MAPRHFLDIDALDAATLRHILTMAHDMAPAGDGRPAAARPHAHALDGVVLLMIFEKPSTRTRVSFDVAMRQLGGETLVLNSADLQLGRGETIADTARVLSRYGDIIMLRANRHETLTELAAHAAVPVINGLTDRSHPCQIMADIMTFEAFKGRIEGRTVAWTGDGNNVARSWVHAAVQFGFTLRLACPAPLAPERALFDWVDRQGGHVMLTEDPAEAVRGADCVVTDTWVSMGDTDTEQRLALLAPYQVNEALMAKAAPEAIFMHCLPAYRGREVSAGVIDGPQSVVFDEAENRLHAQKAILAWCLDKT